MAGVSPRTVCGRPLPQVLREIEAFHGFRAPGLILGVFMVDLAQERLGSGVEYDAIVETIHCLPDAVQLFTPCTVGNGWLKVLDWDKYALTLYDRHRAEGCRVWFDVQKARATPSLYDWFMRRVPKRELPLEVLQEAILDAGRTVYSARRVRVTRFAERARKGPTTVCPGCGEAYPTAQGQHCLACQGQAYYEPSQW